MSPRDSASAGAGRPASAGAGRPASAGAGRPASADPGGSARAGFTSLRALAGAKINLGLFVGQARPTDGKHRLVTVMQTVTLADEIALQPANQASRADPASALPPSPAADAGTTVPDDELLSPGLDISPDHNLAMRALQAFRKATGWSEAPVRLTVSKRIPVAAGMGGGSADAAAALRLAAAASRLGEPNLLLEIAATLGADVPAQLSPGRSLASQAGERLTPLPPPSAPLGVLVLPSSSQLSTADVYRQLDRHGTLRTAQELEEISRQLSAALAHGSPLPPPHLLENDLQQAAISLSPGIAASLDLALQAGAHHAMVSGSGPTVLGLFVPPDGPRHAQAAARRLVATGITALSCASAGPGFGAATPDTAATPAPLRNNSLRSP